MRKPSASSKVFLMKKLFNLKMLEGGSIQDHLNEFHGIVDMLVSVEIEFEDEIQALLLLFPFHNSWDGLRIIVSNSISNKGTLKFEDVVHVVVSEGIHHKSTSEATSSTNLSGTNRGRKNHRGRSQSRGRSKSRSKVKGDCWYC